MLKANDQTLSLGSLFFEKPIVHKVRPLHQEATPWQLKAPPPLNHIPSTQDMQEEAESLSTLFDFLEKPKTVQAPLKGSASFKALSSQISSSYSFNDDETEIQGGRKTSLSGYENLCEGDRFKDYSDDGFQRSRGEKKILQDFGHSDTGSLSLDCSRSPPLRKSLFRFPVLTNKGDSSTKDDLRSSSSSSQTTSGPQTFLSQVAMTTAPPSLQLPQATVGHAAPPFPFNPPLSPPPLGSSAPSGRPPQQDKGTKRAFVPPMTPQPLVIQGSCVSGVLRPVSEIPVKFRSVFSEFPFFNYVQSKALDDVLYTNKNFVACAPTGSGKTVLFELAIIRLLMETPEPWRDVKAVYMAPIKALCSQRFEDWKKKFGPLGLNCKELTGDTEIDDFFEIHDSHIILTTPEKWDSMTRKWKENCLLQLVSLFLIDEVHVVKDTTRGATLEVVVSRMKAVQTYRTTQKSEAGLSMRFVAVSATIPNIADIADWLSNESGPATFLNMDESHRPVKLRKVILGFPCSQNQSEFKFDLSLNYRMANIIQTYSDQKPALVFCSTRKGVQQSAAVLAKDANFIMSIEHKQRLIKYANSILDAKLRDLVMLGVGYHHAGVDMSDRKLIEEAFTQGDLPVLFTTRTLAMGVNLPAHLVVIKSTMQYVAGSCEEYSEADMLQMIGRAGRPQFDTSATAVIMTKFQTRDKYMKLMNGVEIIESSLHTHLVEHLNAEIVLQTISDVNMALDWIRSTFLYIRALKNPTHYGFSDNLDRCGIEAKLQELCLKNLNALSSIDLIRMDEDINIKPTEAGRLMARYYIAFDTMRQFSKVAGTETVSDMIELVSKSREFMEIQLRVNEKRALNTLNRDRNRTTIRFPLSGKIKTSEMKVNCLIQAYLGSIPLQDFGLTQDTVKIFRIGMRISRCLSEFLIQQSKTGFSAVLNSLILAKCFRAKLWENSPYVSKQLEKIGQTLSSAMVNAGLSTFSKIEQTNARELELIVNRHPPFGNLIRESVMHLPKYDVTLEQLPRYSCTTAEIVVKVNLKNQAQLLSRRTAPDHHYVSLIIGSSDNTVVFLQKVTDLLLLKTGSWSKKIDVTKASKGDEISVHLISSEYVGLDIHQKFVVYFSAAKQLGAGNSHSTTGQRPQHSVLKPPSTKQSPTQREHVPSPKDQDLGSKRECNHFCKNKNLCAHECCKVGVTVVKRRSANPESNFSSYLNDLRNRSDALVQTPAKRLKMKMSEESLPVRLQEFTYKPKAMLPPVSWQGMNQCNTSEAQNFGQLPDTVCMNDSDTDFDIYEEDVPEMVEQAAQIHAAPPAHDQSSSIWEIPKTNGRRHSSMGDLSHRDTRGSAYGRVSTASKQGALIGEASTLQFPTVSFDLGNEWDDFDDENLLHASEISLSPSGTNAEPQIPQSGECSVSGYGSSSALTHISRLQAKPWTKHATTPLRSISGGNSEFRKLVPSPVSKALTPQKRITLDWNKKRPDVFSENITEKLQDNLSKQPHRAETSRKLDFFHSMSTSSTSQSSREEEAFLGIFDGIF